jgi:ATP/ADP translocase
MNSLSPLAHLAQIIPLDSAFGTIVFMYFGPETVIPLTSIIAGLIGAILVFWRYIVVIVKKSYRRMFKSKEVYPEVINDLEADA